MPLYSVGILATGIGTTARPMVSIFSAAAVGPVIREVAVYNTTTTAVDVALRRITVAGTPGTAETEMEWDLNRAAAACTVTNVHTADATLATGFIRRALLGAAAGAGVVWTFGGSGLIVPEGTANGAGVVLAAGTGQICTVEIVWEE